MKKKKILSVLLTLAITLGIFQSTTPVQASSNESGYNNITYTDSENAETEYTQNMTVTGEQGGEFVVAVPKGNSLVDEQDNSLKVGIYANIPSTKQLTIHPIDETPDTSDSIDFTLHNIVADGKTPKADILGTVKPIKTSFAWNDDDLCTDLATIVNSENMVEICTYRADITAGEWQGNVGLNISLTDAETSEVPGLYDADGVMLCSWEDSGIDVETNYTSENYETTITSPNFVLAYNYQTATKVVLPNSVTHIGNYAFASCTSLTSITIPNSVTSIGDYAFAGSSLTSITIPNSVTSIGDYAFHVCANLTSITIPNSVTLIRNSAFCECTSLTSITVDSENVVYDSRNDCNAIIETATNTLIAGCKNTVIPDSVTSIGDYAFAYCTNLTSITIPNSVTSIGYNAFAYCTNLTSITIPNSVTSIMSHSFYGCSNLASATFENTSNWYTGSSLGDKAIPLDSSYLADTSTAATYLKSTYDTKYWTRSE